MSKIRKFLTLIPLLAFFLSVIPCQAKEEETTEVKLIDVGHGILVPESFDVKNEDGTFVTITGVKLEDWDYKEVDERYYSMTLDNGYRVEKDWTFLEGTDDKEGTMEITVYNEQGEAVFFMGRLVETGELTCILSDGNGNAIRDEYEQRGFGEGFKMERRTESFDGETLAVMDRCTYDVETDTLKQYVLNGDIMNLYSKYEYSAEGGGVCTEYRVAMMDEEYDQEDEYYEVCSYKKDDIVEESFFGPYYRPDTGMTYGITYSEHPSVITKKGEEYYLYKVASINDNWSTEKERELLEGKVVESAYYFTKEQIEILAAENIIYYHEIMERHPDFIFPNWDNELLDPVNGKVVEAPVETAEATPEPTAEAEEATPEVAEVTPESTSEGAWVSQGSDGRTIYRQPLTGAKMPINGQIPVEVETQTWNYDGYLQITVLLYDANGNSIEAWGMINDLEHTNYEYVYFTTVSLCPDKPSESSFVVKGTDTPFEGVVFTDNEGMPPTNSLSGPAYGEVQTPDGVITTESYYFISY